MTYLDVFSRLSLWLLCFGLWVRFAQLVMLIILPLVDVYIKLYT